jgi:hypothetical protein
MCSASVTISGVWSFVNVRSIRVSEDDTTEVIRTTAPAGMGKRFLRLRVTRL